MDGAQRAIKSANENALGFIATGTPDNEIKMILNRLRLTHYFREVHGSSRQKTVIVDDILGRFDLSPAEVLFIGDAQTDYQAALKNKLDFYLRMTDYNSDWFEGKSGVTYKKTNLDYLHKLINR